MNPGRDCPEAYSVAEIAEANLAVLRRCFPVAMPGANFLSGGQSLGDAAARLSAMNRLKGPAPWNLSFSWSAALQMPLFELCRGTGELQLEAMEALYLAELAVAGAAARGEYEPQPGEGDHRPAGVAAPAAATVAA